MIFISFGQSTSAVENGVDTFLTVVKNASLFPMYLILRMHVFQMDNL